LSKERKTLSMLAQFMRPFTALDEGTWSCLNSALANAQWSHNCADLGLANNIFQEVASLLTYFEYVIKDVASTFENMDACESFSGRLSDRNEDNMIYLKLVWDGDSVNSVPVAELHYTKTYDQAWRMRTAERELDNLITHDIKPVSKMLTEKAPEHTQTSRKFEVPQYHRGSAQSRKIQFANKTSGSDIRQQVMKKIIEQIGSVKDDIVMKHVRAAMTELQDAYTNKVNLYCRCFDGRESLKCCLVSHEDLSTFTHTFAAQYVL